MCYGPNHFITLPKRIWNTRKTLINRSEKEIAMKKGLFLTGIIFCITVVVAFYACGPSGPDTIKIGINVPITGDIPKVGEGTKFAAEMWLEDINAAGGLQVGDKKYKVELVIEDNESKAESAVKVATKLITEDEVLAIVGPQSSKQAVPAGGTANDEVSILPGGNVTL